MNHPAKVSFTRLLDWVEGRLDPSAAAEVEAAVAAADTQTREQVAWIRGFLEDARRMTLEKPPAELSSRLRAAFTGFHRPHDATSWSQASLLHDFRTQAKVAGIRSGAENASLAFESDLGRFVIELAPAGPGQVDVQGLVMLPTDASAVDLAFHGGGRLRKAARTDRDGRFTVSGVPVAVDELWLSSGDVRVRAALDLGHV